MKLIYDKKCEETPRVEKYLFETCDVPLYYKRTKEFRLLPNEEKKKYKGVDAYIREKYGVSLNPKQKNYKKFYDEIMENLEKDIYYSILPVDLFSQRDTIMDLLASLETEKYVKEIYKKKKLKFTGELKTETAVQLTDSLRQGRSLLQSAHSSNMLSKPLIDFYAASAYAYASIVINSPLHNGLNTLKGSHGHTYQHDKESIEFGGRIPTGTFIDLLASIPLEQINYNEINLKYSTLPSLEFVQTHHISISLMALLSCVPELKDQFVRNRENSHVFTLDIKSEVKHKNVAYVFDIGNGVNKPDFDTLKTLFPKNDIIEINGKYRVTVLSDNIKYMMPTIYHDIRGKIWYIEPLVLGLHLPEICLHYIIISALCNIMRYSPHEWNNILSNRISSEFSLLISKYLRLFEIKYPMLITQQLTNFRPVIRKE